MSEVLPKLSKREMNRLFDIANKKQPWLSHAGFCQPTNKSLEAKGLVVCEGKRLAKTGRVLAHGILRLTDLARAVLSGFPEPAS